MIGYLKGRVLESSDGRLILGVGDPDFVGYSVQVPHSHFYESLLPGGRLELYVHTHVREDQLELFGFATKLEKDMFHILLTVNGIGPKGALGILSNVAVDELLRAILEGDKEALVRVHGVGKKTAERVVLELADPVRKKVETGALPDPSRAGSAAAPVGASPRASGAGAENQVLRDARSALVGLGYGEADAAELLNRLLAETATPPGRAEDLIKLALRQMAF